MNSIFYQMTPSGMSYPTNTYRRFILPFVLLFVLTLIIDDRVDGYLLRVPPDSASNDNPDSAGSSSLTECSTWKQVNANAFGLPTEFDPLGKQIPPQSNQAYQGEEGFEVLVFKDQLYLGMEADNAFGARLWRTRKGVTRPQTQLDWEEVIAVGKFPFGWSDLSQADHIDSLAEFDGWIYASTANRSSSPEGILIFRSRSGNRNSWEDALEIIGPGFGKPQNENFKDMQVFDGQLCGGTWNEQDGAEVWCTNNGLDWSQKNQSGFGESSNMVIWSGHVFGGQLYFGLQNTGDPENDLDGDGRLLRTASLAGVPVWEEVYRTEPGIPWGNILGDLDGFLYISVPSEEGIMIYRSPSGDSGSWQAASLPGIDYDPQNQAVLADGSAVHQGYLIIGVVGGQTPFRLWRTDGFRGAEIPADAWEQIPTSGFEDPYNIYVQLASFENALYAWTSNPVHGQQVWRIICIDSH